MKDEDIKDLVVSHDKHIGVMSKSIEHLADAVGTTNRKMEDIVEVLSTQNVLLERVNNIDHAAKEAFGRVYKRMETIEEIHLGPGCAAVKDAETAIEANGERVKVANKRIDDLENDNKNRVPHWLIKWALGALTVYAVSFGSYTVGAIHNLETEVSTHVAEDKIERKNHNENEAKQNEYINRNFGYIKGLDKD